jgi:hypothetical protein
VINGSGFQAGATVTLDGATTNVTFVSSLTITASTSAHAAGTVDLVVTNPGGQSVTMAAAYRFASASLTAVFPTAGTTAGNTPLTITGTGFIQGATVTVGGVPNGFGVENDTTIVMATTPHAPGTVDVVVTNPGGPALTLVGGYTYASPQSFDFNGTWTGSAGLSDDSLGSPVLFVIQNNAVTSFSCGSSPNLIPADSAPVSNGAFSFQGSDGGAVSGAILSPVQASGKINTGPCRNLTWFVLKQ